MHDTLECALRSSSLINPDQCDFDAESDQADSTRMVFCMYAQAQAQCCSYSDQSGLKPQARVLRGSSTPRLLCRQLRACHPTSLHSVLLPPQPPRYTLLPPSCHALPGLQCDCHPLRAGGRMGQSPSRRRHRKLSLIHISEPTRRTRRGKLS